MNYSFLKSSQNIFLVKTILIVILFLNSIFFNAQGRRPEKAVVLAADDTLTYAAPPIGFDQIRNNIVRGKIDSVYYQSKTVDNKRRMLVYTPAGYSPKQKYPVLYLLHGIGGDEKEWLRWASPQVILDNLAADHKIVPMIVVFPNGRAMRNDKSQGDIFAPDKIKAFTDFKSDLLNDIIPYIESHYSVKIKADFRALAGLSMGGGQTLNIGLTNLDTFSWIGAFSSAPNTLNPEIILPNPELSAKKINLLWLSCGNQDGLIDINQGIHRYLKNHQISHIWNVQPGKHDFQVWKNDLYNFSQLLFRK